MNGDSAMSDAGAKPSNISKSMAAAHRRSALWARAFRGSSVWWNDDAVLDRGVASRGKASSIMYSIGIRLTHRHQHFTVHFRAGVDIFTFQFSRQLLGQVISRCCQSHNMPSRP